MAAFGMPGLEERTSIGLTKSQELLAGRIAMQARVYTPRPPSYHLTGIFPPLCPPYCLLRCVPLRSLLYPPEYTSACPSWNWSARHFDVSATLSCIGLRLEHPVRAPDGQRPSDSHWD